MHPVELNKYVLPTNPLEAFVNICVSWIKSNISGAIVPGLQRIGKSYGVEYFVRHYDEWLGNSVAVVSMEVGFHKGRTTEGMLWFDLLRSMKRPTTKHRPEDRRELFVGRLVEAASKSSKKHLVAFVDEAQHLDSDLLTLLSGVHNDLWRIYEIRVTWILVGQPELESLFSTFVAEGKRQILARFRADSYHFQPLTGISDFTFAVSCFDKKMHFPSRGPTYTAHFATIAWPSGYRLASDAERILSRIETARAARGLSENSGMTMQAFTTLMNYIMINLLPKLQAGKHLTGKLIDNAIEATNCMIFEVQEALLMDGSPPSPLQEKE